MKNSFIIFKSILVIWTGMLFSCSNDMDQIDQYKEEKEADLLTTYQGIDLTYSDSAMVKVRITAGSMKQFDGEKKRSVFDNGVHIWFFNNLGVTETEMTCQKMIRYENTGVMESFGNVELINIKKETLNTEHLVYDENKELISTEELVKIKREKEVIWGNGLESNATFTKYKIKKIKGSIPLNNE